MSFENLRGKTALVTGSTSGIGLEVAKKFAQNGINVMLNGFGDIEEAKKQASEFGSKVSYHGADLTKPDDIQNLFETMETEFGGLDILVNNAGIQRVYPVESFPLDRWNAVIATNLTAPFICTQFAIPILKSRGWGRNKYRFNSWLGCFHK